VDVDADRLAATELAAPGMDPGPHVNADRGDGPANTARGIDRCFRRCERGKEVVTGGADFLTTVQLEFAPD
jgi:hypothetical protein